MGAKSLQAPNESFLKLYIPQMTWKSTQNSLFKNPFLMEPKTADFSRIFWSIFPLFCGHIWLVFWWTSGWFSNQISVHFIVCFRQNLVILDSIPKRNLMHFGTKFDFHCNMHFVHFQTCKVLKHWNKHEDQNWTKKCLKNAKKRP